MEKDMKTSIEASQNIILTNDTQNARKKYHPLKDYMWKGIMCFLVIVASISFGFIILRINAVIDFLNRIISIMQPVIIGLILAYILNPIMKWFENIFFKIFKKDRNNPKAKKMIRSISLLLTILVAILFITVLIYAILPELLTSIKNLIHDMPERIDTFKNWVTTISISDKYDQTINKWLRSLEDYFKKNGENSVEEYFTSNKWLKTGLLNKTNNIFSTVTVGVFGFFSVLMNIFIGLIVSTYVLSTKEKFKGQTKKLLYAFLPEKTTNIVLELARDSDKIFLGFLSGKVIDSVIIGTICFIFCSIVNMPYGLIVSVIVGVTNIIPFFGPYIGGIPSTILILLADPKAGIIFLVFVIILQQIDGNFIGPKILGDSTGLSAFWVIFSILLGSGLFGFIGMIFGVPTFGVIYHIIKKLVNQKLKVKKLPLDTSEYTNIQQIKNSTIVMLPKAEEK